MNWIKNIKDGLVIMLITLALYTLTCLSFYVVNNLTQKNATSSYNSNTIRATYPNYEQENFKYAVKIFEDYAAPRKSYYSFVGYRRDQYDGAAVTIGSDGFRNSINHRVNDSVWFFGGSTMWGTGSDDNRTIPSLFAKETGETVLNLGESGYNSVQELVQLQLMLLRGNKPREVIFYDGVNDGYHFCQNDSQDQIRHAYTSRYASLVKDYNNAVRKFRRKDLIDFEGIYKKIMKFYLEPLAYFKSKNDFATLGSSQLSDAPFSSITVTKKYLHCDDLDFAKRAANITINSWRAASALLKDQGIPVWYVLQPTAQVNSNEYKLDHIINRKKQAIVNETDSYESYYKALKYEFFASCEKFEDCSSFIDLSDLFTDINEYIFIDNCHVSPNGNSLVSSALINRIR